VRVLAETAYSCPHRHVVPQVRAASSLLFLQHCSSPSASLALRLFYFKLCGNAAFQTALLTLPFAWFHLLVSWPAFGDAPCSLACNRTPGSFTLALGHGQCQLPSSSTDVFCVHFVGVLPTAAGERGRAENCMSGGEPQGSCGYICSCQDALLGVESLSASIVSACQTQSQ